MGLHLRLIARFEHYARCGSEAYVRPCAKKKENRFATMKFRLALARWFQRQVADRFTDQEMMAIAAEGARALDRREEA